MNSSDVQNAAEASTDRVPTTQIGERRAPVLALHPVDVGDRYLLVVHDEAASSASFDGEYLGADGGVLAFSDRATRDRVAAAVASSAVSLQAFPAMLRVYELAKALDWYQRGDGRWVLGRAPYDVENALHGAIDAVTLAMESAP